jgi:hypothetical protein
MVDGGTQGRGECVSLGVLDPPGLAPGVNEVGRGWALRAPSLQRLASTDTRSAGGGVGGGLNIRKQRKRKGVWGMLYNGNVMGCDEA